MCMDNRNEFGETLIFLFILADKKISEIVYKICSFVNFVSLCVSFV